MSKMIFGIAENHIHFYMYCIKKGGLIVDL